MNKAYVFLPLCFLLPNHLALAGNLQAAKPTIEQPAYANYQAADLALDHAYLQLMSSLDSERQAQLTRAQHAWLTFRDAEAEFRAAVFEGGSIQPLIYSQVLIELTEHRISQLEMMFQEQVGF